MKIFDGHTDIPADIADKRSRGEETVIRRYHWDKLQQGGVTAANFALWLEPGKAGPEDIQQALTHVNNELTQAALDVQMVKHSVDFRLAEQQQKLALVMGMEGLSAIGKDLNWMSRLYEAGVRCASLTWNEENLLATGVEGTPQRGLTDRGKEVVSFMEAVGMLVDVSHLNETSFWDLMKITQKPVMASHSNAWTLCRHPRNLKDDQIKAIGEAGGVIGVNAWPDFLHEKHPSLNHYIDQIEYLVELVGISQVALGFDFCDFLPLDPGKDPADVLETCGLENVSAAGAVLQQLKKRGYQTSDIEKIAYENFVSLYEKVLAG
ncbi:dipeptidase [Anoxynatronum buryatiense]|uniref:Membrane dipeptidase n=1 Tax=Anoxynatronum buryatiense TaxID=489973 RepID=A0AA45WYI1_9CLOT|nr:dipeptidase [Anoxynatronum buryatiense]SMP69196.1 membrane dipeptidase [Anoxynatronum buryatiense]